MIEIEVSGKVLAESIEIDKPNQVVRVKMMDGNLLSLPFSFFTDIEILRASEYHSPVASRNVVVTP